MSMNYSPILYEDSLNGVVFFALNCYYMECVEYLENDDIPNDEKYPCALSALARWSKIEKFVIANGKYDMFADYIKTCREWLLDYDKDLVKEYMWLF